LILEAVKQAAKGQPREKIVEQLPKFPADYIEHAFKMALGDGEIERIPRPSGKEWYRAVPVEDLDGRLQKEYGSG